MARLPGNGPLRIGKQIYMEKDQYSLCFAATFRTEFIYHSSNTKGEKSPGLTEEEDELSKEADLLKEERKNDIKDEVKLLDLKRQVYNDYIISETICIFAF